MAKILIDELEDPLQKVEVSFALFIKYASLGNVYAINQLGLHFLSGRQDSQKYRKALEMFNESAKRGSVEGLLNLGKMYNFGIGVDIDLEKAFQFYKRAASKGDNEAKYRLACLYLKGELVEKDFLKAFNLLQDSSEAGFLDAKVRLALLYKEGNFVEQQFQRSICLLNEAASLGSSEALFHLASFYAEALGVEKDLEMCCSHLYLAWINRYGPAHDKLSNLISTRKVNWRKEYHIFWKTSPPRTRSFTKVLPRTNAPTLNDIVRCLLLCCRNRRRSGNKLVQKLEENVFLLFTKFLCHFCQRNTEEEPTAFFSLHFD